MMEPAEAPPVPPQRVECPAVLPTRRVLLACFCLGLAAWCYADRDKYKAPAAWDSQHVNEAAGYVFNHWGPFVLGPLGVVLLAWSAVEKRRRLVADEAGIGYAGKEPIAWGSVESLDARQLKSKGIAVVRARGRKLVLDSYRFEAASFRRLIELVDRHVPADKHVLK